MAFLRVYDALPVDVQKVSLPVLQLITKLQQEDVEEWEKELPVLMSTFSPDLPKEDIMLVNQIQEWLAGLNPDMLVELVDEL